MLQGVKAILSIVDLNSDIVRGIYYLQSQKPSCMYWNGHQYEVIDCQAHIPGNRSWPLDKNQLKNFKRITRTDTLGYKDIGSVWYTKITADSIEYFTDSGLHPTNQKHLRSIHAIS